MTYVSDRNWNADNSTFIINKKKCEKATNNLFFCPTIKDRKVLSYLILKEVRKLSFPLKYLQIPTNNESCSG